MLRMLLKKIFPVLIFLCVFSACAQKVEFEDAINGGSGGFLAARMAKGQSGSDTLEFSFPKDFSTSGEFSVGVLLRKEAAGNGGFVFGILGDSGGRVSGNLGDFGGEALVSLVSRKDSRGFFVSGSGISVNKCMVSPKKVGFDFSPKVPEIHFPKGGGRAAPAKSLDLSGEDFSGNGILRVKFSTKADPDAKRAAAVSVNGEKFYFRKPRDSSESTVPLAAVKNPRGVFSLVQNPEFVSSLVAEEGRAADWKFVEEDGRRFMLTPVRTDPGLVMWWPRQNWRGSDYELFEWDRFPGVLLMDIADYDIQDDFFRRLAFFVEKSGYRGRLYSDEFLRGKHGYNAHDYRAESLAEFFEAARVQKFPLNWREVLLARILAENGVIRQEADGRIVAGRGAVVSISQQSQMYLRTQFVAHECWHGIFFVDSDFRDFVYSLYDSLDAGTRRYLVKYFQVTPSLNYDINDKYLLRNEFMAYMLQKPVSEVAAYFTDMAAREHSQALAKKEADYILSNGARYFVQASAALDEYVNSRWNLNAGRVWLSN